MSRNLNRRRFMTIVSTSAAATAVAGASGGSGPLVYARSTDKPALLGGAPVRQKPFPSWPILERSDRRAWSDALESRLWNRAGSVDAFEKAWSEKLGARFSIATASGTSALYTSLFALDVGPGDEVIVPPYTFVASINVILLHHALPVFVDSNRDTFQIDAGKIEAAITERTRCIMPVHLGGNMADMDSISAIARKHSLPVLEDACQAHLAEWSGKKAGTLGDIGCFSFQASKNLNSGEGGAIVTSRDDLAVACASFHNAGRPYSVGKRGELQSDSSAVGFSYVRNGDNRRITEFQGALLLAQMQRLEQQTGRREENAGHLIELLKEIPGVQPARMYPSCNRSAYHLFMFRYDPGPFKGLSRDRFIRAMEGEGIPCSSGYAPLNKEPFLRETFSSRAFRTIYGNDLPQEMEERNRCPENEKLCEEAVWLTQNQLLGPRADMDEIAAAIRKVQKNAEELKTV